MLAYLCASRFGLSWAHDAFYFARHMLMHFHAYVPYIQYICVYLNCLGLFWVFLSSPLLSLVYINASMASKRKSAPSQNPLRSRASSSSNPTPFSIWFRDEDARKDFSKNFSWQGIHSECRVVLVNFTDTDLPNVIHSRGWESLCDVSTHVLSCWSRCFTPTCMDLILQYLSFILAFEVHALLSHRSWYPICSMSRG